MPGEDHTLVLHGGSNTSVKTRVIIGCAADNVSQKVVRIILSYTDYVNRTVWRK